MFLQKNLEWHYLAAVSAGPTVDSSPVFLFVAVSSATVGRTAHLPDEGSSFDDSLQLLRLLLLLAVDESAADCLSDATATPLVTGTTAPLGI